MRTIRQRLNKVDWSKVRSPNGLQQWTKCQILNIQTTKKTSLIYDKTVKENNFDLQQTTATTELQTADLRQAYIIWSGV